ncbi:CHAD domain-containing protein [Chromobacterium vaccinii]|uniref:CHAD domain-containing protein n=1 Tax=Chromobacterium vaccinii TaxID=1108595 RepID=UPI0032601850
MAKKHFARQQRAFPYSMRSRAQARTPRLRPAMSCAAALKRIALECLRQLMANTPSICEGNDAEPIHQGRVAIRRLRTALKTFAPLIRGRRWKTIAGDLKWLAGIFGKARDLDVLALETLPAIQIGLSSEAMKPALIALSAARRDGRAACRVALASRRWRTLPSRLLDGLTSLPPSHLDNLPRFASHTLKRQRADMRRLWKQKGHSAEQLHELRKQGKKLRYAIEFFSDLELDGNHKRFLNKLRGLLQALGDYNDAVSAREWCKRLEPEGLRILLAQRLDERASQAEAKMLAF